MGLLDIDCMMYIVILYIKSYSIDRLVSRARCLLLPIIGERKEQ